jgi:putative transposase
MEFHEDKLYHIYNRGNNRQKIFFKSENYIFFLQKIRKHLYPFCDILCYCLMPNHFHFLIYINDKTIPYDNPGNFETNILSGKFRNLLSSYTQAVNKQQTRSGSLFQQNTKSKCISDGDANYARSCFHYIHQNPYKARLVTQMEDWEYSSFRDYTNLRAGTLCNQQLAFEILDMNKNNFYLDSYKAVPLYLDFY